MNSQANRDRPAASLKLLETLDVDELRRQKPVVSPSPQPAPGTAKSTISVQTVVGRGARVLPQQDLLVTQEMGERHTRHRDSHNAPSSAVNSFLRTMYDLIVAHESLPRALRVVTFGPDGTGFVICHYGIFKTAFPDSRTILGNLHQYKGFTHKQLPSGHSWWRDANGIFTRGNRECMHLIKKANLGDCSRTPLPVHLHAQLSCVPALDAPDALHYGWVSASSDEFAFRDHLAFEQVLVKEWHRSSGWNNFTVGLREWGFVRVETRHEHKSHFRFKHRDGLFLQGDSTSALELVNGRKSKVKAAEERKREPANFKADFSHVEMPAVMPPTLNKWLGQPIELMRAVADVRNLRWEGVLRKDLAKLVNAELEQRPWPIDMQRVKLPPKLPDTSHGFRRLNLNQARALAESRGIKWRGVPRRELDYELFRAFSRASGGKRKAEKLLDSDDDSDGDDDSDHDLESDTESEAASSVAGLEEEDSFEATTSDEDAGFVGDGGAGGMDEDCSSSSSLPSEIPVARKQRRLAAGWTCNNCGNRNKAPYVFCSTCYLAPQDESAHLECHPLWLCPCGHRNNAQTDTCTSCHRMCAVPAPVDDMRSEWECIVCKFLNKPKEDACHRCAAERPDSKYD